MEQQQIKTDLLPKPLVFRVFLPPCYTERPETRYPVLYLFHGQFSNDDQWDRMGVDETAARLISSKALPPFLIVMPFDREFTTEADDSQFDEAIITDLVPHIDQTYRTLPGRSFRAIGGLSRGAGWALQIGMDADSLFGTIGLHSPAIFWDTTPGIPEWLDSAETGHILPRLYLDIGDHDTPEIVESATWFEGELTRRNIDHEFYLFPGYHDEKYWGAHLENYLRWYAALWTNP